LTTLFGDTRLSSTTFGNTTVIPIAPPKKKPLSLLPLLTALFVISYGLMTLLIVEQGTTIQAQHNLIQVLLGDSTQLWALKGKALHDKQIAQAPDQNHVTSGPSTRGQAPSVQTPSTQTPSTQTPSTQTPLNQAPSTQVPQHRYQNKSGKTAKPEIEVPPVPASDLSDQRRNLITL
jgi:hypothetical protein